MKTQINKFVILLFLSLFTQLTFGQNKLNENGLSIGYWKENTNHNESYREGHYIIISKDTLEIIDEKFMYSSFKVSLKNATLILDFKAQDENLLSVRDGIWNSYDENGDLEVKRRWLHGVKLWTKDFNKKGELIGHNHEDLENDISFYDKYVDNKLFKRSYYLPENRNREVVIYYPNARLGLSDAELYLSANFLYKPIDTTLVKVFARNKAINIKAITCSSKYITILDVDGKPFKDDQIIKESDTLKLQVVYRPHPSKSVLKDSIVIKTNQEEYKIKLEGKAFHIDYGNAEEVKKLELSKKNDQFLIVSSLGTLTECDMNNAKNEEVFYENIYQYMKLDLLKFENGIYELFISSCNTGAIFSLKLTD